MEEEEVALQAAKTSLLPFEDLPNLPRPLVPQIDLDIDHTDLLALQCVSYMLFFAVLIIQHIT